MFLVTSILLICSLISIIAAIAERKKPGVPHTRKDGMSYVLDAVLVCFFLFMELQFIATGFAGTVEGFEIALNVLDHFTMFLLPVSLFTIAASIALRNRGKSGLSFLLQFSTVPFYPVCLLIYNKILL